MLNVHKIQSLYKILNINMIALHWPIMIGQCDCIMWKYSQPKFVYLLGRAPTGTGTITFDPTFGSFTLLKLVSTLGELVSLVKVFRLFKLEHMFFWCSECGHTR